MHPTVAFWDPWDRSVAVCRAHLWLVTQRQRAGSRAVSGSLALASKAPHPAHRLAHLRRHSSAGPRYFLSHTANTTSTLFCEVPLGAYCIREFV